MKHEHDESILHRVLESASDSEVWNTWLQSAEVRPELWRELALAWRDQERLREELDDALQVGEQVVLPLAAGRPGAARTHWISLGGWVAAALLALGWAFTPPSDPASPNAAIPETARLDGPPLSDPDTRLVRELPLRMVRYRALDERGRLEVFYIRPLLERTVVDRTYTLERDELGLPTPVPIDAATLASARPL